MDTALLHLATSLQAQGGGGGTTQPRSAEDLEFLRNAMKDLKSPSQMCQEVLYTMDGKGKPQPPAGAVKLQAEEEEETGKEEGEEQLTTGQRSAPLVDQWSKPSLERVAGCLEELQDLLEDLDVARDFCKMNGPVRIFAILRSRGGIDGASAGDPADAEDDEGRARVRQWVTHCIATSAQNHPEVQATYQALRWTAVLLPLLKEELCNESRNYEIMAVSCLCRGHIGNITELFNNGGLDVLESVLCKAPSSDPRSVTRCLHFLCTVFAEVAHPSPGVSAAVVEIFINGIDRDISRRAGAEPGGNIDDSQQILESQMYAAAVKCLAIVMGRCKLRQGKDNGVWDQLAAGFTRNDGLSKAIKCLKALGEKQVEPDEASLVAAWDGIRQDKAL